MQRGLKEAADAGRPGATAVEFLGDRRSAAYCGDLRAVVFS